MTCMPWGRAADVAAWGVLLPIGRVLLVVVLEEWG